MREREREREEASGRTGNLVFSHNNNDNGNNKYDKINQYSLAPHTPSKVQVSLDPWGTLKFS